MNAILASYAVVNLLLNRGLIGRDWTMLLASYHLPTFSFLAVLAVVVAHRHQVASQVESAELLPLSAPELQIPRRNKAA
jgi:hypothetical protein